MQNLNICIDIDGTITDPYYWLEDANRYFNLNVKCSEVNDYNIEKVLNVTRNDYLKFYEEKKYKIHKYEKLREDVKGVLDILYTNNNIYFVTARDKSLTFLTIQYLQNHKIPYDDVFVLGDSNKVPAAKSLNCNIFIEDSYENAAMLSSSNFKVLLLDTNYNKGILPENVTRVSDWNEIYSIITKLSQSEQVI